MIARAVIGASFGDEGKGLMVDYLCAKQGAGIVVRFNGGAQVGHTVVTPDGLRHVFGHFGSGTFLQVPTFLSEHFILNPLMFFQEQDKLIAMGVTPPAVYAHPNARVTTFADMIINQNLETNRGAARHGSVGLGISETVIRSKVVELSITMSDLWNRTPLDKRLHEICDKYSTYRTGKPIPDPEKMIQVFKDVCDQFAERVMPLSIAQCEDPVFEGAQGLLLDQDNKEFFPHVTYSKTGLHNVKALWGDKPLEAYYVSRTYLTRHGAGPLPGEDPKMSFPDDTNVEHAFQGRLRFAPLDTNAMLARIKQDAGSTPYKLAFTHCDQVPPPCISDYQSYGPTRTDVEFIETVQPRNLLKGKQ